MQNLDETQVFNEGGQMAIEGGSFCDKLNKVKGMSPLSTKELSMVCGGTGGVPETDPDNSGNIWTD